MALREGRERRDRGAALVTEHNQEWADRADGIIRLFADSGKEFTANDVTDLIGLPDGVNAVGPRFMAASRRGVIRRVGFVASTRTESNARIVSVWVGK